MKQFLVLGILKTTIVVVVFVLGCLSIVFTQFIGVSLGRITGSPDFVQGWMAHTKEHFIVLLTAVITFASREDIKIRISTTLPKERFAFDRGRLKVAMAPNSLVMANHQIYTDWAFLWWLAQCADLGGFVYIILKASLRSIPVLGFGMSCYEFLFLSRKWEKDKIVMGSQLEIIDANARGKGPASGAVRGPDGWLPGVDQGKAWPYQVLMYPEGTNLSANTRGQSEAYAKKVGKHPFKHVLLPKITGLRFTLLKLKDTLDEVYDVTVGYSGVKPEEYGQDVYTLYEAFLMGRNPQCVDFHIRTIKLDEIPMGQLHYDDPEQEKRDIMAFDAWMYDTWKVKDDLMDAYYNKGGFPTENTTVITSVKASKWKFLQIFTWPLIAGLFFRGAYGAYRIYNARD